MIKWHHCTLLIVVLYACKNKEFTSVDTDESKTFVTYDTIPDIRQTVSKEPVATYTSSTPNKLVVKVYETKQTFQFFMKMQYEFLNEPDTLHIPNFGIRPQIIIREGADKQSCVVGFLDKKNEFKEYKLVTVKTGNLQLKVLKRYFAGAYKTTFDDTTVAH